MSDRADVLARLARAVAVNAAEQPLTNRLCEACRVMLGADTAAITIENTSPNRVTLCATNDIAARLEDVQDLVGEGPGRDAFVSGFPVIASLDREAERRWPLFASSARRAIGPLTIYAFPMRPGSAVLGVLTLTRCDQDGLDEDLPMAQFLSDAVGAALLRDPLSQADLTESGSWASRSEVHQATGIVVAQLRVPVDDALALLKAHAYAHDLLLEDVARLVIERRVDFTGHDE
jgi:GAF domain-containing protein